MQRESSANKGERSGYAQRGAQPQKQQLRTLEFAGLTPGWPGLFVGYHVTHFHK